LSITIAIAYNVDNNKNSFWELVGIFKVINSKGIRISKKTEGGLVGRPLYTKKKKPEGSPG
jgi:hypothetical protein